MDSLLLPMNCWVRPAVWTVGTEHKVAAVLLCEGSGGDYPGPADAGGADIVYLMQDPGVPSFPWISPGGSHCEAWSRRSLWRCSCPLLRQWAVPVAPRLAANLRTGLTADCTKLELRDNGLLIQTRPTFGGEICMPACSAPPATGPRWPRYGPR